MIIENIKQMDNLINSADQLIEELKFRFKNQDKPNLNQYLLINSSVRKEFLLSDFQNRDYKILIHGKLRKICFEHQGNGIYKAYILDTYKF